MFTGLGGPFSGTGYQDKKERALNGTTPNKPMSTRKVSRMPVGTTVNYSHSLVRRHHLINIDSRARDINGYPNENDYRFKLKRTVKNVTKIEIVTAEIPNSDFVINENNNKLDVIDNGNTETVTIPIGDYDAFELANQFKISLDALGYSTWTVSLTNGKYVFGSTNNFSLLFLTGANADSIVTSNDGYNFGSISRRGSIRSVIGFNIEDTSSGTSATSTNKINLGGEKYIVIELGPDVRENLDSYDDSGNSAFGKIVMSSSLNCVQCFDESLYDISRSYNPPLRNLEYLRVKFRTYGGNLYNFRGHEHSFMLRITTME